MRFFLSLLFFMLSFLGAEEYSKIAYLKLDSPQIEGREFYVGEKIEVKYTLLLFSNASLADVEFIPNEDERLAEGAELLNPQSSWKKVSDDTYENVYFFKIKSPSFALPTLQILAVSEDESFTDTAVAQGVVLEAVELGGERYSGVVAQKMQINHLQAKKYDENYNIIIFDISTIKSNLEDFHIPNIERQGFKGEIAFSKDKISGSYYAITPKEMQELRLNYFNLENLRYEEIALPIIVKNERVSTQSDLEPKNTFLIFSNIALIALALLLLVCAFYFRKNKLLVFVLCVLALAMIVYVVLKFESNKNVILKQGGVVAILPTKNSTILERVAVDSHVEVIGERGEYYKIKLGDSRIGWVKKDECK